jgi:hypothetical protein
MKAASRLATAFGGVLTLALLLNPLFFLIFRMAIFSTMPRDDYAPYLLWLLNEPGGAPAISPFGYRILSVLLAAPLYYVLPPIHFTNVPADVALPYLRATAALSALSFIALISGAVLAYRLVIDRYGLGKVEGIFAGAFVLVSELYVLLTGVDPIAILVVLVAVYFIDRIAVFAALMIASAFFNEKILIMFVAWLSVRCVFDSGDRTRFGRQWLAAIAGLAVYCATVAMLRLPGHAHQLDPSAYVPMLLQNIAASFSGRGVVLNLLPCVLLIAVVGWSWWYLGKRQSGHYAQIDLLVVAALAMAALALTQTYQVGRIVAHAVPIFVLPVAQAFGVWARRGSAT